jgi:hypothetical protein
MLVLGIERFEDGAALIPAHNMAVLGRLKESFEAGNILEMA